MNIGLDLSVIQTAHRMRGIGATAINFVNSMPANIKDSHTFVLFVNEEGYDEALSLLHLEGMSYQIRTLLPFHPVRLKLPGKLRIINSLLNSFTKWYESSVGDPKTGDIRDLDYYLQFDQMQSLPKTNSKTRFGVIIYDLIPYVMESDYLWSYRTARLKGCSRKGALRRALLRRRYIGHLKTMGRRAHQLFAISDYTKRDFVKYTRTSEAKIQITYLGIDESLPAKSTEGTTFTQYMESSWGQLPQAVDLIEKPFLLFLGGADPRRKLIDLFAAYNNLKARGYDIRLVLAGDTMKGRRSLPTSELQNYLANESYISDIAFLGFVDDTQREWLFDHALAMVYPSVYEGFGLPVLEAMRYGTPVITYNNSSIKEIAGDAAIFAHDSISIFKSVEMLLLKPGKRASYSARGKAQASKFSWSKTVTVIVSHISS